MLLIHEATRPHRQRVFELQSAIPLANRQTAKQTIKKRSYMCGFVSMVGLNGAEVDPQVLRQMSGVLRHRGPDDEGSYISRAVGFGFRRLSILDLSPARASTYGQ